MIMNENEFVEFWAYKCKTNPKKCMQEVNNLVNSQIQIGNDFYKRIGRKKSLEILNKK